MAASKLIDCIVLWSGNGVLRLAFFGGKGTGQHLTGSLRRIITIEMIDCIARTIQQNI
jgi:hypothetical protein